jgi:hypothetical protein
MYFFRFIIIFGLIQVFTLDGVTQLPAVQVNEARFTKEFWGGLVMHSQGFGINFNYSKFKTYKKKRYYTVDFVGMRHEKEYKIFGSIDESAKRYVYGKLNSFMVLRVGTGGRKLFLEKLRENGLQIALNWSLGPSIGLTKPVYLEVLKIDSYGQIIGYSIERYDPEEHNIYNIYGRGPWSRGFSEARFHLGGFMKLGCEFEFSDDRGIIKALEIGAVADLYPHRIPIMTQIENPFVFPTVYISILIGAKYY